MYKVQRSGVGYVQESGVHCILGAGIRSALGTDLRSFTDQFTPNSPQPPAQRYLFYSLPHLETTTERREGLLPKNGHNLQQACAGWGHFLLQQEEELPPGHQSGCTHPQPASSSALIEIVQGYEDCVHLRKRNVVTHTHKPGWLCVKVTVVGGRQVPAERYF